MGDSKFGMEDSRGFWAPKEPVSYGPAFDWPPPKVCSKERAALVYGHSVASKLDVSVIRGVRKMYGIFNPSD